jgi:hypothetical protein
LKTTPSATSTFVLVPGSVDLAAKKLCGVNPQISGGDKNMVA